MPSLGPSFRVTRKVGNDNIGGVRAAVCPSFCFFRSCCICATSQPQNLLSCIRRIRRVFSSERQGWVTRRHAKVVRHLGKATKYAPCTFTSKSGGMAKCKHINLECSFAAVSKPFFSCKYMSSHSAARFTPARFAHFCNAPNSNFRKVDSFFHKVFDKCLLKSAKIDLVQFSQNICQTFVNF